jgi:hypothetical protein
VWLWSCGLPPRERLGAYADLVTGDTAAAVAVCFATRSLKTDVAPVVAGVGPPCTASGDAPLAIGLERLRLMLMTQA